MQAPFFIAGCVRSGTSLLRDLLRQHPRLACPEETHFFRWPEPFGSSDFLRIQENNPTLRAHRAMDGVGESDFTQILAESSDRRDLMNRYMHRFLEGQADSKRWFDKTPQHVYGALLISAYYPSSCFIHLHRHPLNVVASLKEGKALSAQSVVGAINYWLESVVILDKLKTCSPGMVLEVAYENLTRRPQEELARMLSRLGIPEADFRFDCRAVHGEKNRYREILTAEEIDKVCDRLAAEMSRFGYGPVPD